MSEPTTHISEHGAYVHARDGGIAGAIGNFWKLQSELGCDVEFRMPAEQEIVVTAPGNVTYRLWQVGSHRTDTEYIYRLGMEINGEYVEAKNPNNMPESYLEALNLLQQMVEHDPQNEIEPRPTHMNIRIPVSE